MAGAGLTVASVSALASMEMADANDLSPSLNSGKRLIEPRQTILFQGDSITDVGRNRELQGTANLQPALGSGYPWLAASQLLVDWPNYNLRIFNRGNGGNKLLHLVDRWQADCIHIKPSILSIIIGVNDFWPKANDVKGHPSKV